jgi:hypothetical protein
LDIVENPHGVCGAQTILTFVVEGKFSKSDKLFNLLEEFLNPLTAYGCR